MTGHEPDTITALEKRIAQLTRALESSNQARELGDAALSDLIAENAEMRERLQYFEAET
jgi:hypothetical protein